MWSLLFDFDGTLVDSIDLLLASMRHAFDGHWRAGPTTEDWVAGIGRPLQTQIRPYCRDDAEVERLVARYRSYQREHHDRYMRCYDGTVQTVRQLHERGHPIAVVTSKAEDLTHRGLRYLGLDALVDVVVGVESTTRHKPDPEPVLFALERLGGDAARAVFVGDSPHDMHAGNAAGVVTVAALWGPFTREQLTASAPAYYLERIDELPALIDRIAGIRRS
jgi:pyrophosphatase PpaX